MRPTNRKYVSLEEYGKLLGDAGFTSMISCEYVLECGYCRTANISIFIEPYCWRCCGPLSEADEFIGLLHGEEEVWLNHSLRGAENLRF